jgi:putative oxidoreductase
MNTHVFTVNRQPLAVDIALLLTRLAIGYAFLVIGWGKIQNPTDWMRGLTFAPLWQVLAAVAEFGGGLALLLGFLTRLGALGIACVMVVATWVHKFVFMDPYINFTGGSSYQVAVAYGCLALLLLVLGPGRFSLDRRFFGLRPEQRPTGERRSRETADLEHA